MAADEDPVRTSCPTLTCGVPFWIPGHIWSQIRSRGKERVVFCPNGHEVVWSETNEDRLKRQLESVTRERDDARASSNRWYRTAIYWKGRAHRKAGA